MGLGLILQTLVSLQICPEMLFSTYNCFFPICASEILNSNSGCRKVLDQAMPIHFGASVANGYDYNAPVTLPCRLSANLPTTNVGVLF